MPLTSQTGPLWMVSKPPGERILFPTASRALCPEWAHMWQCRGPVTQNWSMTSSWWPQSVRCASEPSPGHAPKSNATIRPPRWGCSIGFWFCKGHKDIGPLPSSRKLLERLTDAIPCFHLWLPPVPTAICSRRLQFLPRDYSNEAVFPTAISDLQIKTTIDVFFFLTYLFPSQANLCLHNTTFSLLTVHTFIYMPILMKAIRFSHSLSYPCNS